ncbi:hypothetical protein [Dehalogenimonas alkenigignens]|nr:hypothetical protein [Dehalogenimonas alkenigignens]
MWFISLWLVALPQTDVFASCWAWGLKKIAKIAILFLLSLGLATGMLFAGLKTGLIEPTSFNPPVDGMLAYLKSQPRYSDGAALVQQATVNFIEGQNPYTSANVITAMEEYDSHQENLGPYINLTPLQEGRFADVFPYPAKEQLNSLWQQARLTPENIPVELESRLSYPAGSFLIQVPFVSVGIANMQYVIAFFLLIGIAAGLWLLPRRFWMVFVLAVAISLELWVGGLIGLEKRLLLFPFILAGWLLIPRKPLISALLLGAAAATYQTVWFLLPFAGVYVFHCWGFSRALRYSVVAATIFIAINLPFLVDDPALWLASVTAPIFDRVYPLGVGLVSLVQTGIVNVDFPFLFTGLEITALVGGLIWYLLRGGRYPQTGLLFSVMPIFFAWRSFNTYFFLIDLALIAALLIEYERKALTDESFQTSTTMVRS